ncbi:hypothetical protein J7K55_00545 [Candidatus Aerophobetes bacterium]|nr:hypothetical protein [Candidatus Aerophobetes bacterium]
MAKINLKNACDLHIHAFPSLMERMGDDVDLAKVARDAEMQAIMFKSHHESTVSRAYHTSRQVPGIKVFGGIVLNRAVGGINPIAVEAALKLGAKEVWMPTMDSAAHAKVYGSTGTYGYMSAGFSTETEGITILTDRKLDKNVITVLELTHKYNVIIGTSHLSKSEIFELVKSAGEIGNRKVVITHPYWKPPDLNIESLKKLAKLGAIMELCAGTVYPVPGYGNIYVYRDTIQEIGAEHFIISSDAGRPAKSTPPETIRIFAQCLSDIGICKKDLEIMMIENPTWLLDI